MTQDDSASSRKKSSVASMPRVRFRCTHCNRLLSAPADKMGRAIACPKCVQATIVPVTAELTESEPPTEAEKPPNPATQVDEALIARLMAEESSNVPEEVLAIQPEDIRAEFVLSSIQLDPNDVVDVMPQVRETVHPEPEVPIVFEPSTVPRGIDPGPLVEIAGESCFIPTESPPDVDESKKSATPVINVDAEEVASGAVATGGKPIAMVTLPASVVLAWSLFVLFALAFSFIAGLFVGHYHWKNM